LLDYCLPHKVPLDFYSWHTYANLSADPYDAVRIGQQIRSLLDAKGFRSTESCLSEWALRGDFTDAAKPLLQGVGNSAFMGAVMIYLQDSTIDRAIFYRGDAAWNGLFGGHGEYLKPAYTFRALGAMRDTPERIFVTGADTFGFAVLAGRSRDGRTVQVLISNYRIPADYKPFKLQVPKDLFPHGLRVAGLSRMKFLPRREGIVYSKNRGYDLTITNLPWGEAAFSVKRYRLTKREDFSLAEEAVRSGGELRLSNLLPPPGLELIILHAR
jgi:hypothetical protein